MAWKSVRGQDLWKHDGTTAITGLSSGVRQYQPGAGGANGTIVNGSASSQWMEIDTQGADILYIQYEGRVLDRGDITAVVPTTMAIAALGVPHLTDESFAPQPTILAPNLMTTAAGGLNQVQRGTQLWYICPDFASPVQPCTLDLTQMNAGLLFADTITNNSRPSWRMRLGERGEGVALPTQGATHPLYVQGISKVWVAFEQDSTITGTPSTLRLRCAIFPVLVYLNIQQGRY